MDRTWAFITRRFTTRTGRGRTLVDLARSLAALGNEVSVHAGYVDERLRSARGVRFEDISHSGSGPLAPFRSFEKAARKAGLDADLRVCFDSAGGPGVVRLSGGCQQAWVGVLKADPQLKRRSGQRADGLQRRLAGREQKLINEVERVLLAPSAMVAEEIAAHYGREDVRVLEPGVDIERFRPGLRGDFLMEMRRKWGVQPEDLVVLFVGGSWARRGLDRAMEALAQLAPGREDLRMVVVGESRKRKQFLALSEELGVRSRMLFVGAMEWVEHAYAAADLVVLPTRYSPAACVPLEALAAGVPVVTSTRDGSAGVLGGLDAVRVIQDSPGQLVEAMDDLMNAELFPKRARVAREWAEAHDLNWQAQSWSCLADEVCP